MLPAIRILTSSSSKGRIGFQSNIIGQIVLGVRKLRQKFRRDNHIIGTRNNLDVFYFEVERKLFIGFTNNDGILVRSIILLITNNQFNYTSFHQQQRDQEVDKLVLPSPVFQEKNYPVGNKHPVKEERFPFQEVKQSRSDQHRNT